MMYHCTMHLTFSVAVVLSVVLCGPATAQFNPQPEPPGMWYVEGYIDMWADSVDPTSAQMPFGIDPAIIGDGALDFSAGIVARFSATSMADDKPVDGVYDVELEYFRIRIGDTSWNETLPNTGVQFQIASGIVSGMSANFTCTMPAHPDLEFWLPTSPGAWEARDIRDDVNLGVVTGMYSLRDGVVPEPSTLALLLLGAVCLVWRRRRM